mmetsp:Transcript_59428/g.150580  ORF Transcript_59428/g.150580 Transcript_59428/m.150580 type:complete len:209 (+) Transcript_59428:333-959(+)
MLCKALFLLEICPLEVDKCEVELRPHRRNGPQPLLDDVMEPQCYTCKAQALCTDAEVPHVREEADHVVLTEPIALWHDHGDLLQGLVVKPCQCDSEQCQHGDVVRHGKADSRTPYRRDSFGRDCGKGRVSVGPLLASQSMWGDSRTQPINIINPLDCAKDPFLHYCEHARHRRQWQGRLRCLVLTEAGRFTVAIATGLKWNCCFDGTH